MQKPQGYDGAQARQPGQSGPPAGPYVMKIVSAEIRFSSNNNEMLVMEMDIASGEFAGAYKKRSDTAGARKYQVYRQLTEGDHLPYFKGAIKAIEESNKGFTFDFDESKLVGKLVGASLREEEYKKDDGTIGVATKPAFLFPADKVATMPIIAKKKLGTVRPRPLATSPTDDSLPF